MPRRMKYSPHLVTISETATMSKEKESPIAEVEESVASSRSKDARIERSHSAPPEAEATDRHMPTTASKRGRSQSAKCLHSLHSTHKPETETRATSPTTKDKQPASPRKSSKYGRSALHNAVRKGDKQAIKKILETEPELLYQADSRGNHPLHYAASPNVSDGFTVCYMLLKAGASVNALNDRQQTPLLISVISNDDDDDKVARILLFHHAKPMIKVTDDLMLAQYASSWGLHKIAAAIREYM
ncbi:Ankyrin repeats (3 copies) [Phytophthora infestans]|uniref:Ankyrin repeats (3 copies) n=1 Tax=Phytophthora infestans TaxID=4787 RepID=A0A833T8X1_PHYIN|nr:Ankyrin repeats (3 copies) [Phytophthora infestans]